MHHPTVREVDVGQQAAAAVALLEVELQANLCSCGQQAFCEGARLRAEEAPLHATLSDACSVHRGSGKGRSGREGPSPARELDPPATRLRQPRAGGGGGVTSARILPPSPRLPSGTARTPANRRADACGCGRGDVGPSESDAPKRITTAPWDFLNRVSEVRVLSGPPSPETPTDQGSGPGRPRLGPAPDPPGVHSASSCRALVGFPRCLTGQHREVEHVPPLLSRAQHGDPASQPLRRPAVDEARPRLDA